MILVPTTNSKLDSRCLLMNLKLIQNHSVSQPLCLKSVIPATRKTEVGKQQIQGQPGLRDWFKVSLGKLVRPHLKIRRRVGEREAMAEAEDMV